MQQANNSGEWLMRVRNLVIALGASAVISVSGVRADHASLSDIFMQFPPAERRVVQLELMRGGFYEGPLDAAWSDATSLALFGAADFLSTQARIDARPDMSSPEGITTFLSALSERVYADRLYGKKRGAAGF
ncbi:hypothetical protein [Limimaricola sp.]|uniref:hypothetical protein n=1 Tax=Limimaricola sp. TaxID=2211665 RepID=UPI0040591237